MNAKFLKCAAFLLTLGFAACSGDGTGIEPVKTCQDTNASNYGGPLPCKPKVIASVMDSMELWLPSVDASAPPPVGMTVTFTSGGKSFSRAITDWNKFRLAIDQGLGPGVLSVDGGTEYESKSWSNVTSGNVYHAGLLYPKRWPIRAGDFAGQTVAIPSADLKSDPGDGSPFLTVRTPMVEGWQADFWPAKVTPTLSYGDKLNEIDSILKKMNGTVSFNMLVLGTLVTDTNPNTGSIVMRLSPSSGTSDGTPVSYGSNGIISGRVQVGPNFAASLDHELIHALGFGHMLCKYKSRMAPPNCTSQKTNWFTVEDVAVIQIGLAIRAQSLKVNADLPWM